MSEFVEFPKIPRLNRDIVITEKIDGANAQIYFPEDGGPMQVGTRTRWISQEADWKGLAKWAHEHEAELRAGLGFGRHFGEWWGQGIGRGYGLTEKRFSLFNTHRWGDDSVRPACCGVVPVLYRGPFSQSAIDETLLKLTHLGSVAAPGFMKPEGVVVFHTAASVMFKVTCEADDKPKGAAA